MDVKVMTTKMMQEKAKKKLLVAILNDIDKSEARALYWAEKFVNKLLPSEQTLKGDSENPIELKLYGDEQLRKIAERTITAVGINQAESEE